MSAFPGSAPSAIAWTGACGLLLLSPFEASRPLMRLPGQSVTSVEAALTAACGVWLCACAISGRLPWRSALTIPWLVLIGTMFAAALLAPAHRTNALNMTGRLVLALVVYLMTVHGARGRPLRAILRVAALGGVLVAALTILEYYRWPAVVDLLRVFRAGGAHVGAQIRASGPLQYPTIASMYLEITFALTLGLLTRAVDERRAYAVVAGVTALVLMAQGIIVTFTRAGLLTLSTSLALVAFLRIRESRRIDPAVAALAGVALAVVVQFATSRPAESLRLRMSTEGQENWYRASVDAPLDVVVAADTRILVPVRVTNHGLTTWDPEAQPRFRFSYHWLNESGDRVVWWEGERTDFPGRVAPGATVPLAAHVRAPRQPGRYRLMWDVEHEHRLWFSTEPDAPLFMSRAVVTGGGAAPIAVDEGQPLPRTTARPGRLVLWRAASRMIAAHPVAGVGPDNFRLLYGSYIGLANPDPRVHTNNMYIEMLVSGGVLGGAAALWLFWRAGAQVVRLVGAPAGGHAAAAVAAAGIAIGVHGLVDSFVSFTPTYTLMAIVMALTVVSVDGAASYAHRV
jgi:O-antigen ligase